MAAKFEISYEWFGAFRTDDEYQDCEEWMDFSDSLPELLRFVKEVPEGYYLDVRLRRRVDRANSLRVTITEAVVKDGKLSEYFQDSYGNNETKVPAKFLKQFEEESTAYLHLLQGPLYQPEIE